MKPATRFFSSRVNVWFNKTTNKKNVKQNYCSTVLLTTFRDINNILRGTTISYSLTTNLSLLWLHIKVMYKQVNNCCFILLCNSKMRLIKRKSELWINLKWDWFRALSVSLSNELLLDDKRRKHTWDSGKVRFTVFFLFSFQEEYCSIPFFSFEFNIK